MKKYLEKLSQHESLSQEEMLDAAHLMFTDEITDSEMAAFLIALKSKGETADEIASLASVLRKKAISVNGQFDQVMDNCGTGGDGSQSFNISTASAFVLAGAGIKVAKHGNRSVSSKTGSADVLEALGVNLHLTSQEIEERLEAIGIAFLFASKVHPNISRIMKIRKELKISTVFNYTGPLTNPVQLDSQLLGINKREMLDLFASVLDKLGRRRALIINGAGYMDEASLQGTNSMILLENGKKTHITLNPEDVGLPYYTNDMIRGGDARENADIMLRILQGEKGAYRDTVLLNAGLGIYANGKTDNVREGIAIAKESIDSGRALQKLEALIHSDTYKKAGVM
ncbi:anthranilate phosphoribosyltransferase [Peribacillus huizhouensis]|uniref:Anthranilate phosphoribosyltransferase n=1 Tax=Peribacillus huizhouensis TaxID=1501239 RepID=A0ABR6CIZ3_9BACI|nr:anthranilate phosphoribosyltransferase [Peribacillus huizhouensis]MBA9025019.1 anthranilate phosphoribosyltransferase [Peribacillus huizhouensis]